MMIYAFVLMDKSNNLAISRMPIHNGYMYLQSTPDKSMFMGHGPKIDLSEKIDLSDFSVISLFNHVLTRACCMCRSKSMCTISAGIDYGLQL